MKSKKIIAIISGVVTVILSIIALIVLPPEVVTQFSVDAVTKTDKIFAVGLPFILGIVGSVLCLTDKSDSRTSFKGVTLSCIAVVILIIMFAVNL